MPESMEIIIPVYNEGENIVRTLSEIEAKVKHPYRVLVVYDFDQDNTLPPLRRYMESGHKGIRLEKNHYGRGALNAIRTGFESAEGDLCLVCMGDLSDDMSAVGDMLRKMDEGCDVVCGSRYMEGGRQIGGPLLKRTLSRLAGTSLHFIAGVPTHDVTNSFKMYRRSLLERIEIESSGGFEIGMEILVKAHLLGCKIGEVPSTWRDRSGGESKFRLWKWLPNYLHWYFLALKSRFKRDKSGLLEPAGIRAAKAA
jgi:glycosyltransferase involved in cell wall biosynthesis